jgi:hypothetical protein
MLSSYTNFIVFIKYCQVKARLGFNKQYFKADTFWRNQISKKWEKTLKRLKKNLNSYSNLTMTIN